MKIGEKRVLEWWELPGIEGREGFDEEILYLNEIAATSDLPRWALLVRDLFPRFGFEPCAHRFFDGLEQVLSMIGAGRPGPRLGGCGDVPVLVHLRLAEAGKNFLSWVEGKDGGEMGALLGAPTRKKLEAVRAVGEALLAFGRGWVAVDAVLESWAEQAKHGLTKALVDDDEAPLPQLLRHACSYNTLLNIRRLAESIGQEEIPQVHVCRAALMEMPKLAPERLGQLSLLLQTLPRWLKKQPPTDGVQAHIYALLGPHDPVREWLVASLYKTLKIWQTYLDGLHGRTGRWPSLI